MQERTGNHWLEHIELKMTIWSTHCNCNMVSHDLKFINHDTNSESSSNQTVLFITKSYRLFANQNFISKYFNKMKSIDVYLCTHHCQSLTLGRVNLPLKQKMDVA